MRHRIVVWCLFLGVLNGPSGASGQTMDNESPCARALPTLSGGGVPYDGGGGTVSHGAGEGTSGLYVSPEGRLCRSLQFLTLGAADPQVAVGPAQRPAKAFLLSALLPGAGQWYLDKERWPAYLAAELWAWLQFLDWRREGRDLQREYKDLAWLVARRVSSGRRTEAGWDYYEALTKYPSSGAYDADPLRSGIQPEEDPGTFNGSMWLLAREIYFPEDPEIPVGEGSEPYQAAFDYYLTRAYRPELAWDWRGSALQQHEYTKLIRDSDEALRSSTAMIGVILANHLLSAVDALVAGRLGLTNSEEPLVSLTLSPGPFQAGALDLRVDLPDLIAHVP